MSLCKCEAIALSSVGTDARLMQDFAKKCMNNEKKSSEAAQPRESTATQGVIQVTLAS